MLLFYLIVVAYIVSVAILLPCCLFIISNFWCNCTRTHTHPPFLLRHIHTFGLDVRNKISKCLAGVEEVNLHKWSVLFIHSYWINQSRIKSWLLILPYHVYCWKRKLIYTLQLCRHPQSKLPPVTQVFLPRKWNIFHQSHLILEQS